MEQGWDSFVEEPNPYQFLMRELFSPQCCPVFGPHNSALILPEHQVTWLHLQKVLGLLFGSRIWGANKDCS